MYIKVIKWAVVPGETEEKARLDWDNCIEETLHEEAVEFTNVPPVYVD